MTPLHIVAVSLRLLAVAWLLYWVSHIYDMFAYLGSNSDLGVNASVLWAFAILQLAMCAVLWFFPATIARKLLPSPADTDAPRPPVAMVEWQTLGVICIGIWALTRAVPDAIYWLTFYSANVSAEYSTGVLDAEQKAGIVMTITELVIGFWLVFGAKGFAALVFKLRTAGVAK